MHDHDLDLIASLADGSLDDPTEARALIETCPECRGEYEAHLSVIVALATMEPVTMSDFERAALHRDLWTELRSQPAKTSATPWWYRFSYAAAGLFVLVGLVAVVNQLGSGGSGPTETFSDVSSELDAGSDGQTASPLAGEESAESTDSTIAESTDSTMTAADSGGGNSPDFETLANEARLQQLPPSVRATASTSEDLDCVNAAGLENQEVVGTVEADRKYLIAVANDEDLDADTAVNFVDAATCEVSHVEE
jgi:hypothetical protein